MARHRFLTVLHQETRQQLSKGSCPRQRMTGGFPGYRCDYFPGYLLQGLRHTGPTGQSDDKLNPSNTRTFSITSCSPPEAYTINRNKCDFGKKSKKGVDGVAGGSITSSQTRWRGPAQVRGTLAAVAAFAPQKIRGCAKSQGCRFPVSLPKASQMAAGPCPRNNLLFPLLRRAAARGRR